MFDLWYSRLREPCHEDNEKFIQIWLGYFRELVASISSVLVDQKLYARYFYFQSDGASSPASSHSSQFDEMIAARRRRMAQDKQV